MCQTQSLPPGWQTQAECSYSEHPKSSMGLAEFQIFKLGMLKWYRVYAIIKRYKEIQDGKHC